jgi:hypothetical protein
MLELDKKRNSKRWEPATFNRYKALISIVYPQGISVLAGIRGEQSHQ